MISTRDSSQGLRHRLIFISAFEPYKNIIIKRRKQKKKSKTQEFEIVRELNILTQLLKV